LTIYSPSIVIHFRYLYTYECAYEHTGFMYVYECANWHAYRFEVLYKGFECAHEHILILGMYVSVLVRILVLCMHVYECAIIGMHTGFRYYMRALSVLMSIY
jgi:hypothetical protein